MKNLSKEYKIPYGQYNIKVKCIGRKNFNALVIGRTDTSVVFKIRQNNKTARRQIRAIYSKFLQTADSLKYTNTQFDSVMVIVKNKENEILYPIRTPLNFSQIKKLNIDKHNRPERIKQMKFLETSGYITLTGQLLVAPIVILVAPSTVIPYIATPLMFIIPTIWVVADLILETERLNLKTKWKIKQ